MGKCKSRNPMVTNTAGAVVMAKQGSTLQNYNNELVKCGRARGTRGAALLCMLVRRWLPSVAVGWRRREGGARCR